ncbi:MAG: outer membrane beta-barrel protein, partial [Bacteroidota bacterium]
STIVRYQNRFDASQNLQTIVPVNLSNQQTFTASATFPIRVSDWWNMRFYAQYTYQEATSEDQGEFYTFDQNTFFINGSQSFTLPNDFELELSGFFRSPTLDGNVNFEPVGILNFGIQKRLKNNASLSFNIGDVLNSLELISSTNLPQQNFFVERLFDFSQRTFNLSYSMSFGNQKMNNSRNRQTEELNRVN